MTSLCHCGRGSWRVHHRPLLIFSMFAFLTGNLCLIRHCKKCPVHITGQSGCRLRKNLPQCTVLQVPRKGRESVRAMRSSLFQAGSLQTVQEVTRETARTSIQGRCRALKASWLRSGNRAAGGGAPCLAGGSQEERPHPVPEVPRS